MTTYTEQIKELCDLNSLHYHIDSNPDINRVLIDDEFWFYINNMDDIKNFNVYIDIIKGRNEMVNTICDKLNTTIEKGCNLKLFEYHQNEMVCISDNSIFINIKNLTVRKKCIKCINLLHYKHSHFYYFTNLLI